MAVAGVVAIAGAAQPATSSFAQAPQPTPPYAFGAQLTLGLGDHGNALAIVSSNIEQAVETDLQNLGYSPLEPVGRMAKPCAQRVRPVKTCLSLLGQGQELTRFYRSAASCLSSMFF
jgi:hypothetical protein